MDHIECELGEKEKEDKDEIIEDGEDEKEATGSLSAE